MIVNFKVKINFQSPNFQSSQRLLYVLGQLEQLLVSFLERIFYFGAWFSILDCYDLNVTINKKFLTLAQESPSCSTQRPSLVEPSLWKSSNSSAKATENSWKRNKIMFHLGWEKNKFFQLVTSFFKYIYLKKKKTRP